MGHSPFGSPPRRILTTGVSLESGIRTVRDERWGLGAWREGNLREICRSCRRYRPRRASWVTIDRFARCAVAITVSADAKARRKGAGDRMSPHCVHWLTFFNMLAEASGAHFHRVPMSE